MKQAIGLVALSLALEAGFLFQIAQPARAPASTANDAATVRTVKASDAAAAQPCPASRAVVQAAAVPAARG